MNQFNLAVWDKTGNYSIWYRNLYNSCGNHLLRNEELMKYNSRIERHHAVFGSEEDMINFLIKYS